MLRESGLFRIFLLVLILHLVRGIERQRTALKRSDHQEYELVHIAKTAGRSIKFKSNKLGEESPLSKAHKHSVRVSDVIRDPSKTAVVVLRDPIDRFESAFTFVRSGGFGNRINPSHKLKNYNSSDSLISALGKRSETATDALRCDAKLRYCASARETGQEFDLYKHVSVEFKPQTWWMDVEDLGSRVKIVCYPDVTTVFPLKKISREKLSKMSAKGHFYIQRRVEKEANKAILDNLYKRDRLLYQRWCAD